MDKKLKSQLIDISRDPEVKFDSEMRGLIAKCALIDLLDPITDVSELNQLENVN